MSEGSLDKLTVPYLPVPTGPTGALVFLRGHYSVLTFTWGGVLHAVPTVGCYVCVCLVFLRGHQRSYVISSNQNRVSRLPKYE